MSVSATSNGTHSLTPLYPAVDQDSNLLYTDRLLADKHYFTAIFPRPSRLYTEFQCQIAHGNGTKSTVSALAVRKLS